VKLWSKVVSTFLAIVVLALPLLGCGGQRTNFDVTPSQGAEVTLDSFTLEIPRNGVNSDGKSSVSVVSKPPELFSDLSKDEESALSSTYAFVGNVYDVQLGSALTQPATVTLEYTAQDIPSGFSEDDLYIVQYIDGGWDLVESRVDPATQTLSADVSHFSLVTICAAFGVVVFAGIGAMIFSLLTQPAFIGTAHRYLTPSAYNIKDAVSSGAFVVDAAGNRLLLNGVTLKAENRSRLARPKTGSEMMSNATGMCEDFSNLFGSLLICAGYPVRAVGGNATYLVGNGQVSGGHAWIEVLVGKEVYYVDTFDPKDIKLIPIEEARRTLNLKPGLMWGKTADGKVIQSRPYDESWPLVGKWKLQRTNVSMGYDLPNLLLDQIFPGKPDWELTRGGDEKLTWNYDGRPYWFNPRGQSVTPGPTIVEEGEDATSCTMYGSGSVFVDSLPPGFDFILSLVSSETKKVEDIQMQYEDSVEMVLVDGMKAMVTVTADINGTYESIRDDDSRRQGSFTETVIITYEATRVE